MKLSDNKILVTGGASGIGRGIAERFLKEDNTVIICGRRTQPLDEMAKQHPDLNVLVNNAGIQNWMSVSDKDFFQRAQQEIAINIEAPLHLTSLFLGLQHLTTVMNVTSGLSFSPLAKVPVYSATKAFFHSFTLSLRHLLKSRNIEVVEIVPPALDTDLGGKGIHSEFPPVADFIEAIFAQLADGKQQLTFGFSEAMTKAGADQFNQAFARMNP